MGLYLGWPFACSGSLLKLSNMDYFNDPELNGKYLGTITKDFATASNMIKEA